MDKNIYRNIRRIHHAQNLPLSFNARLIAFHNNKQIYITIFMRLSPCKRTEKNNLLRFIFPNDFILYFIDFFLDTSFLHMRILCYFCPKRASNVFYSAEPLFNCLEGLHGESLKLKMQNEKLWKEFESGKDFIENLFISWLHTPPVNQINIVVICK